MKGRKAAAIKLRYHWVLLRVLLSCAVLDDLWRKLSRSVKLSRCVKVLPTPASQLELEKVRSHTSPTLPISLGQYKQQGGGFFKDAQAHDFHTQW